MKDKKRLNYFKVISKFLKGRVLDIGFNQNSNPFLKSPIGIDKKISKKPKNYKAVYKMDCQNIGFKDNLFDTVIANNVFEHLENPGKFLKECKRILKNDGIFIIGTPNPYYPPIIISRIFMLQKFFSKDDHFTLYSIQHMKRNLENNGFKVKKIIGSPVSYEIIYISSASSHEINGNQKKKIEERLRTLGYF